MVKLSNAVATAQCNAAVDAIDGGSTASTGSLVFYSGTAPATAGAALSGNGVLATLLFANPAFGDANMSGTNAVAALSGNIEDTSADGSGDCVFARALDRDGTCVLQFSVSGSTGGAAADISVTSDDATATFTENLPVEISTFTFTQPSE